MIREEREKSGRDLTGDGRDSLRVEVSRALNERIEKV